GQEIRVLEESNANPVGPTSPKHNSDGLSRGIREVRWVLGTCVSCKSDFVIDQVDNCLCLLNPEALFGRSGLYPAATHHHSQHGAKHQEEDGRRYQELHQCETTG